MNDRTVTARILTDSPLHAGAGDPGVVTDLPVLRDTAGDPYIPGTQIAGRLREIATRLAPALGWAPCSALDPPGGERTATCTCPVCDLFGSRGRKEDGGREPAASRLWCYDAPLVEPGPRRTLVRDGVGISRRTGGAAADAQALYDAEWIPAGTAFRLRLELEHPADHGHGAEPAPSPSQEEVLALALSEWQEGRGRLGGGSARGGGAFSLCGLTFRRADLSRKETLRAYLSAADPSVRGDEEPGWLADTLSGLRSLVEERRAQGTTPTAGPGGTVGAVAGFARVTFVLSFDGALLVNDPAVALAHGVHGVPVLGNADWTSPVLPGSTLRGVLRSQVERIARTVAIRELERSGAGAARAAAFARACPACDPLDTRRYARDERARALIACARVQQDHEDAVEAEGRGTTVTEETPPDCLACALFGSIRRGSRLWITDAAFAGTPTYRLRDFVAIDRFTGGALDGAKFDALPLYGAAFTVSLLLWDPAGWELAALALALRDVHDGLATVGSGSSKGFGRASVRDLAVDLGRVAPGGPALGADEPARWSGVFREQHWSGTAEGLVAQARAQGWAGEFVRLCARARRAVEDHAVPWDAWYGPAREGEPDPSVLYPLMVDLGAMEESDAP